MKSNFLITGIGALIISATMTNELQALDSKYRLGLQGAHFVSGISGVMEVADPWALQVVLDLGVDAIAFRVLDRFHQDTYWNSYVEGTLGIWDTDGHRRWGRWDEDEHKIRGNDFGLGFGIGIEYDWRGLNSSLPPLGWNIELGANVVPFFDLGFGLGVHWMF